jgi:hypothetical protein
MVLKKPHFIEKLEDNLNLTFSVVNMTVPCEFDKYIENKQISLEYSESIREFDKNKLTYKSKLYKTKQDFYLYLLFDEDKDITLNIFYKQSQINELTIFLTQLIKDFITKNKQS